MLPSTPLLSLLAKGCSTLELLIKPALFCAGTSVVKPCWHVSCPENFRLELRTSEKFILVLRSWGQEHGPHHFLSWQNCTEHVCCGVYFFMAKLHRTFMLWCVFSDLQVNSGLPGVKTFSWCSGSKVEYAVN